MGTRFLPLAQSASLPASAPPAEPARLWTPERDAALRRMWLDESLTQSAIAAVLSAEAGRVVSRGNVARRISEKGWAGTRRNQGSRRASVTIGEPERAGKLAAASGAIAAVERRPEPASARETASQHRPGAWPITDLAPDQCRYPCTDDPGGRHLCCGARTFVGRGNLHGSWCPEHLRVVWGDGTAGERAAGDLRRVRV